MSSAARVEESRADAVFSALADPTRRRILHRLAGGPASVGELAEPFSMSLPAVSRHLRVLERAGLLRRQRRGRVHLIRLNVSALEPAGDFLDDLKAHWMKTLDGLAAELGED